MTSIKRKVFENFLLRRIDNRTRAAALFAFLKIRCEVNVRNADTALSFAEAMKLQKSRSQQIAHKAFRAVELGGGFGDFQEPHRRTYQKLRLKESPIHGATYRP